MWLIYCRTLVLKEAQNWISSNDNIYKKFCYKMSQLTPTKFKKACMRAYQINGVIDPSRQELIEGIIRVLEKCKNNESAHLISIEAPSGWGKTKLVQTLYSTLAAAQKQKYWPLDLSQSVNIETLNVHQRRKIIKPSTNKFNREVKSLPDFLWMGISCESHNIQSASFALTEFDQIEAHRPYVSLSWAKQVSLKEKILDGETAKSAAKSILEDAFSAVFDEIPGVSTLKKIGKWAFDTTAEKNELNRLLSKSGEIPYSDTTKLLVSRYLKFLKKLAIPKLPVIVAIEDFHLALKLQKDSYNPITHLVSELLSAKGPILILTTGWQYGKELIHANIETISQENFSHITACSVSSMEFPNHVKLLPASNGTKKLIIDKYYPRANKDTIKNIIEYYNNPLAIELFCSTPKYASKFKDSPLKISKNEILKTPHEIKDMYFRMWTELTDKEKALLCLCSLSSPKDQLSFSFNLLLTGSISISESTPIKYIKNLDENSIPKEWLKINKRNKESSNGFIISFHDSQQKEIVTNQIDSFFFEEQIFLFLSALALHLNSQLPEGHKERYTHDHNPKNWINKFSHIFENYSNGIEAISDFQWNEDVIDLTDFFNLYNPFEHEPKDILDIEKTPSIFNLYIITNTVYTKNSKEKVKLISLNPESNFELNEAFYRGQFIVGFTPKFIVDESHKKLRERKINQQRSKSNIGGAWVEKSRLEHMLYYAGLELEKNFPKKSIIYFEEAFAINKKLSMLVENYSPIMKRTSMRRFKYLLANRPAPLETG